MIELHVEIDGEGDEKTLTVTEPEFPGRGLSLRIGGRFRRTHRYLGDSEDALEEAAEGILLRAFRARHYAEASEYSTPHDWDSELVVTRARV